ncbi:MAG: thioesterase domain-containing protein, partial [Acidobacteriota bacterium]|nr:thioesterase domain-containing protein [Acidobacteriota bacterium]
PTVPIGRAIGNVGIYILDPQLNPVPVGVPGQLYIAGSGLARGYHGHAALTACAFLPHPFARTHGERLYASGDLARFLYKPDEQPGLIEFIGRIDHQVKLRGLRIELGEIEARLSEKRSVSEVCVLVREDRPGNQQLAAYVVPADGHEDLHQLESELTSHLAAGLPEYMVPATYIFLKRFPLTPSGKIDRKSLPKPEWNPRAYVAPRDEWEQKMADLWLDLLPVERVSVTDNFFALGGHSLVTIRLVSRIKDTFGVTLPFKSVFENPSVEELVLFLRNGAVPGLSSKTSDQIVPIQEKGNKPPLFFIPAVGGDVWSYRNLVQALDQDRPCYGLVRPIQTPPSVTDRARRFVAAIKTVQPKGPYYLAGWSSGGVVAFEAALQLRANQDEVAWVGLLDSFLRDSENVPDRGDETDLLLRFARHTTRDTQRNIYLNEQQIRGMNSEARLTTVLNALKKADALPAEVNEEHWFDVWRDYRSGVLACDVYRPGFFDGHVTLFRAASKSVDQAERWRKQVTDLTVRDVNASHYDMLDEPHAGMIAACIAEDLDPAHVIGFEPDGGHTDNGDDWQQELLGANTLTSVKLVPESESSSPPTPEPTPTQ